ncbi:protein NRT1/ PTR FAMILY 5.1 [Aegilops tauschii subsp. strangulata]|uniref:Peptide transporter PTR5 n=1 Tax=Aegilops tauschii subsp. strangulata TaxID=200361 RepID=A0A453SWR3_AEGTS|nr:protein NRT1/ PTR FAMILY 5.1 [Aegilops tauschii subsp. strangulata]
MEELKPEFTKDGSVDLRGRPVVAARTGRWKACSFLVGYEAFERMAFYGVASNLVVYLTTQMRQETVPSVRSVNNWTGTVWMTPIAGAYVADAFLGRFWTFTVSSLIYLSGMVLITLAVSLKPLHPQCTAGGDCAPATRQQVAFLYAALYTMAIGAGGTKPNISTFGADQFDDFDAREREVKASFFNWWLFSSFAGGLVAVLVLVYVQEEVGWGVGYTIPTVGLALSLVLFYVGTPFYRHKPVTRSTAAGPARLIGKVLRAAYANRGCPLTGELHEHDKAWYAAAGKRLLLHTEGNFRCLDKAAIREREACTVTEVEEVKLIAGMIVVWLVTLVPCTIWAQVNTLFVKQGTTLDRSVGGVRIPAASLGSFVTISMLVSIPIYDRVLVPLARRRTGNPRGITLLQRLGVGCALQVLVVACAWLVEARRMRVIRERGARGPHDTVPMSVFWMLPQYVLLGVGDVFNSVGILEFFYDQSPEGMRSLGTTFFTSGLGAGNFLNSLLVTLVDRATATRGSWIGDNLNDSHLDYYYAFLLLLTVANMALFVWVAMRYKYKREFLEDSGAMETERETEMVAGGKAKADLPRLPDNTTRDRAYILE